MIELHLIERIDLVEPAAEQVLQRVYVEATRRTPVFEQALGTSCAAREARRAFLAAATVPDA
jgi:hypothetical protein